MAVKTAKPITDKQWNYRVMFPKDNYTIRCTGGKTEPSQAGNPNTRLDWEIVNCDPKEIGGIKYHFDGVTFATFHTTKVSADTQRTEEEAELTSEKCFAYYDELLTKCGVDTSTGWDDENPPVPKGKVVYACLWGKEMKDLLPLTPEQKAAGKTQGAVRMNPVTGKPDIKYQIQIQEIFGAFDGEVRPF